VGAHCWGSEESDPRPPPGRVVGVRSVRAGAGCWVGGVVGCGCLVPGLSGLARVGGWLAGVGLLFEIWIVDASIKIFVVVSSVHHQPGVPAAVSHV
jgi:hypothetical protein